MHKHLVVLISFFLFGVPATAAEEPGLIWKRTAKFRSLSHAEQLAVIRLYNERVESVADEYRAGSGGPITSERDRLFMSIARCSVDSAVLQGMQPDPQSAAARALATKYMDSCGRAPAERFIADEWREARKISALDYLLDYKELRGQNIAVKGSLLHRGQLTLLHPPGRPDAYIVVSIDDLTREERQRILLNCASGCAMEVYGKAGDIVGQMGLAALRIR